LQEETNWLREEKLSMSTHWVDRNDNTSE